MRRLLLLYVVSFLISKESFAVSQINVSPSSSENIPVQTFSLEVGKTLKLPAQKPARYLIASPEVAVISELKPDAIEMKAQKIGSTLMLIWEETGIRSIQVTVTRAVKEIEKTKEIQWRGTKLYRSQQERTFRGFYDSQYSVLEQSKTLRQVTETRKVYNHDIGLQGNTPLGDLRGHLFYEYRKDQNLEKSVALPRDMWMGLFNTDFPFTNLLDNYDMSVGTQYLRLSNFGFPGSRFMGFTIVPSAKRTENPERGRMDFSFFLGRERLGAFLDNPAGTNKRNVKLKNRMMGEKVDMYLWKDGRVSLGSYQKWAGPTQSFQSKKNFDTEFDFGFPYLRLKGETGLDQRVNVAWRYAAIVQNSWAMLENRFLRVNPHYNTITGTVLDKGRRGYQLRTHFIPLKPLVGYDAVALDIDADIIRDLLSLNPKHPDRFNKTLKTGVDWHFPYSFRSQSYFEYQDKRAYSFPFTKRKIREKITKEVFFNSQWVKRGRLFGIATMERYGDAEATPGFNATRYEIGGGTYVSLYGGLWVSAQYLWDRLDEKEPTPRPDGDGRTYPGQMVLSGGIAHSFEKVPIDVNLSIRYTDERKTVSKLHQPFSDEDRFEARGLLNWRLPSNWILFLEGNASSIESLTGTSDRAELSLLFGTRLGVDTHFYIPQFATIEGYFFIDKNMNGVHDADESGIADYEVRVEGGSRTKSDQWGHYRLRAKEGIVSLKVTQKIPEGYFFTTLNQQEIEALPKAKIRVDFGIVPQTQIKGRAYLDVNANSIFDKEDLPMPAIQLLLESGQLAVTSAQGLYSILRVRPGPNRIETVIDSVPSGYKTVSPVTKQFDGRPGDLLNFDIVFAAERTVNGYVFEDTNGNQRRDAGEEGIEGAEVLIGNARAITGHEGRYLISNLAPGIQMVRLEKESIPENYEVSISYYKISIPSGFYLKSDVDFPVSEKESVSDAKGT